MSDASLDDRAALVVFSGGQDSATCLAWALDRFDVVHTVGYHYGQLHAIEMTVRPAVRESIASIRPDWRSKLASDQVFDAGVIGQIGQCALTGHARAHYRNEHLPDTFVPGRNISFLTLSAALSYRLGARHIITGVCETDYSGYPDCRDDTIKALQVAVNLGCESRFVFHTPLMWIDKAGTWKLAAQLGGQRLVDVIRTETHTCYQGDRGFLHDWGYGCGECAACELRSRGWEKFRATDVSMAS